MFDETLWSVRWGCINMLTAIFSHVLCAQDEFTAGVSELCKAKLEKPKRLSELAGRWWNEIYAGTYLFDRQVGVRASSLSVMWVAATATHVQALLQVVQHMCSGHMHS